MSRSFTAWAEGYDLFAQPIVNFNIRGKSKVSTNCGIFWSFILIGMLVYAIIYSFIQIATY